ncbi:hypothetical protein [Salinisphaera hydrothermalis]|uniref:hypothetical protein n=1 Tax=Salinisphaera hydrothermalis TaxID=563188 RepID=UPI00334277F0
MKRNFINHRLLAAITLVLCGLALTPAAFAGSDMGQSPVGSKQPTAKQAALVDTLMSAAPKSVAKHATILSRTGKVLKKGDSEWVCRFAGPADDTPTCLDKQFRAYLKARSQGKTPHVERVGLAYMLQGMTMGTGMHMPPHVMLIVPNLSSLKSFPTTPQSGTPWVMKADTPYAHLIIPMSGKTMGGKMMGSH